MVEPVIGHIKADGLLDKIWLKGAMGDATNATLCCAGRSLRMILMLLRMIYFAHRCAAGLRALDHRTEHPTPSLIGLDLKTGRSRPTH